MSGGDYDKTEVLSAAGSLPGLISYGTKSEYAPFVDAVGQFVPGMLSGGNIKGLVDGWSVIVKPATTTEAATAVISTVDAWQDTWGVYQAVQEIKTEKAKTDSKP